MENKIIEKLGDNHTETIEFTVDRKYDEAYGLYTFENEVFVLQEGMDIPFTSLTEAEQKEIVSLVETNQYKIDNTIQ